MKVTVLLFAHLREIAGHDKLEVELPHGAAARDVLDLLFKNREDVWAQRESLAFAINRKHVKGDAMLHDGDEVALLPPMSGG